MIQNYRKLNKGQRLPFRFSTKFLDETLAEVKYASWEEIFLLPELKNLDPYLKPVLQERLLKTRPIEVLALDPSREHVDPPLDINDAVFTAIEQKQRHCVRSLTDDGIKIFTKKATVPTCTDIITCTIPT